MVRGASESAGVRGCGGRCNIRTIARRHLRTHPRTLARFAPRTGSNSAVARSFRGLWGHWLLCEPGVDLAHQQRHHSSERAASIAASHDQCVRHERHIALREGVNGVHQRRGVRSQALQPAFRTPRPCARPTDLTCAPCAAPVCSMKVASPWASIFRAAVRLFWISTPTCDFARSACMSAVPLAFSVSVRWSWAAFCIW